MYHFQRDLVCHDAAVAVGNVGKRPRMHQDLCMLIWLCGKWV
jgi:hypothetical protein